MSADDAADDNNRRWGQERAAPDTAIFKDYEGALQLLSPGWIREGTAPLCLDIGMGMGRFLLAESEKNPDMRFIGVDTSYQCIKKVLQKLGSRQQRAVGLDHVRIFYGSIYQLLRLMPAGRVDRAYINYPDPWFKRRHLKRRLVCTHIMKSLGGVLKRGAEVYVQTDISDYNDVMEKEFAQLQGYSWRRDAGDAFAGLASTLYQEKAAKQGLPRFMHVLGYHGTE